MKSPKSPRHEKNAMGLTMHQMVYLALFLAVVAVILGGLGTKAYYDVVDNPNEVSEVGDLTINGKLLEYRRDLVDMTAARIITNEDSGKVFTLDSTGGAYIIALPNPVNCKGAVFEFLVKENTPTGDITIRSTGANVYGNLMIQSDTNEDNRVAAAGVTDILVKQAALKGDWIRYTSDGTSYYVVASGGVQGSFTAA